MNRKKRVSHGVFKIISTPFIYVCVFSYRNLVSFIKTSFLREKLFHEDVIVFSLHNPIENISN